MQHTSFWLLLPQRCLKQSRHPERWWWYTLVCMSRWGQRARSWRFLTVHAGRKGNRSSLSIRWKSCTFHHVDKAFVVHYLQFADGGQQTSPISSQFSFLLTEAKLHSEEITLKHNMAVIITHFALLNMYL